MTALHSLAERWATDTEPFEIKLGWEVLPSASGHMHLVDPDPDAQFENYPVSLCGKALQSKDGTVESGEVCEVCLEISRERQAEFDA